jgi:hypothetical protein
MRDDAGFTSFGEHRTKWCDYNMLSGEDGFGNHVMLAKRWAWFWERVKPNLASGELVSIGTHFLCEPQCLLAKFSRSAHHSRYSLVSTARVASTQVPNIII